MALPKKPPPRDDDDDAVDYDEEGGRRRGRDDRYRHDDGSSYDDSDSAYSYDEDDKPRRSRSKSLPRRALRRMGSAFRGLRGRGAARPDAAHERAAHPRRSPSPGPAYDYGDWDDYAPRPPRARGPGHRARRASTVSRRARSEDDDSERWKQRLLAAADAAAVEAFRLRKEPGSWMGAKGRRLATVALTAAAADGFLAQDGAARGGRTQRIESALAGLLVNRLVNGPRRTLRRES
ncbi:hypothetical protein P8C59_005641 [Phyllachora maydis]|nr:hypothetical protein P8C59_005641 [Phyllachora maydis]